MRVLTKSRFKLGLECPNKLHYTRKPFYANRKEDDTFMLALADGGFQVEEIARLHYPGGKLLEGHDGEYKWLWNQTQKWLKDENTIIFEAAFLAKQLFVRTDILVKNGNNVNLIEVKSKSFEPNDKQLMVGSRGGLLSKWKLYLFDVAFQKYVIQQCYPNWAIRSFILMADKTKQASVNGLNQMFRISKKVGNRTGVTPLVDSLKEAGTSVLGLKEVTEIVADIESGKHAHDADITFEELINNFRQLYLEDRYPYHPTAYTPCRNCEFKATAVEEVKGLRSGFKECFKKQHDWVEEDFAQSNLMDISGINYRRGQTLMDNGILELKEITKESIGYKEEPGRFSQTERAWMQIQKSIDNDSSISVDHDGLREAMNQWIYPLHFIDFETATAALPFNIGMHPYETTAFQFSHHIMYENGSIEHVHQFIEASAGVFPNFNFLRRLKKTLSTDQGTIFRYADHENSVLNAIYIQLNNSEEEDRDELMAFIQEISHSKKEAIETWVGSRDMVDLLKVVKDFYFNPYTKGSNSLKHVLPAILKTSTALCKKYSKPLGDLKLTSLNMEKDHIWLDQSEDGVLNPYKSLPTLFEDWEMEDVENLLSDLEGIEDGGAAMVAYGKLQYTDMGDREREEIIQGLLKYCELDTLAMVMLVEHFKELV